MCHRIVKIGIKSAHWFVDVTARMEHVAFVWICWTHIFLQPPHLEACIMRDTKQVHSSSAQSCVCILCAHLLNSIWCLFFCGWQVGVQSTPSLLHAAKSLCEAQMHNVPPKGPRVANGFSLPVVVLENRAADSLSLVRNLIWVSRSGIYLKYPSLISLLSHFSL